MSKPEVITIDEVKYVRADSLPEFGSKKNGLTYVICRTQSAGVFAGYLENRKGQEVILLEARRLWYWVGAASLSQAAVEGFSKPRECKFPVAVMKIELLQAIEILDCSEKARLSIEQVPVWKA